MSFLVPSILWGLFAAIIPIVIHLISTRHTQQVPFSTVRFIKQLEHDTIRKLKFRQILLLIIRTLIIIMLVFAFSRPVKQGYFSLASNLGQTTRIAIVIDNSVSMGANIDGSTLLEKSKGSALTVFDNLEGEIIFDIYQTSPFKQLSSEKTNSIERIRKILESIPLSYGPDKLWMAVDSAIAISDQAERDSGPVANHEIYIFSDFPVTDLSQWGFSSKNDWRMYLFPQLAIENNLKIENAGVSTLLKMPNQLISIETFISKNGDSIDEDIAVQLFLGDSRVGQVVSDFQAFDEKNFTFKAFTGLSGINHGLVEIPEDEFNFDNRRFFQFEMIEKIKCLILQKTTNDLSILEMGISSLNESMEFVEIKENEYGAIGTTFFNNDVVFLVEPSELNFTESNAFVEFIIDGGSGVIFLGDTNEEDSYNWLEENNIGLYSGVNRLSKESFYFVDKLDINHPLFFEFPSTNINNELPQVYSHANFNPFGKWKELLLLSNHKPLLFEKELGSGRLLIFSIPPNLEWTNFPLKPMFIPLLHRILIYLSSQVNIDLDVSVGDTLILPIPREHLSKEILIKSPNGTETKIIPNYSLENIQIEEIESVGIYSVFLGKEKYTSFIANIPSTEDPFNRLAEHQLEKFVNNNAVRIILPIEDPVLAVDQVRKGTELWHIFILCAFILLLLETWIGRIKQ